MSQTRLWSETCFSFYMFLPYSGRWSNLMNAVQMGFKLDKIWQISFEILKTLLKFDTHPNISKKSSQNGFKFSITPVFFFVQPRLTYTRQNSQTGFSVHVEKNVETLQAVVSTTKQEDADPSAGLSDFFGFRHERVIVEAVEESYRDCLRCSVHATKKKKRW